MSENTSRTGKKVWLGGVIGLLSGLWGVIATIIFTFSIIRMISPDTPVYITLQSDGKGFLYLSLHLIVFLSLVFVTYLAMRTRRIKSYWSRVFIIASIIFVGLSLIPGSTIGPFMLPATIGMLLSGILLKN